MAWLRVNSAKTRHGVGGSVPTTLLRLNRLPSLERQIDSTTA
jgi:hypothetical protein